MNVLITGAASPLARHIAARLGPSHHLRLMDAVPVEPPKGAEFCLGSLLEPSHAWRAVRGVQAVIHTAAPPPDLPPAGLARDQALLDLGTRGTHALLTAAVEAGVRQCVYAGTLGLFAAYPDDLYITENWKPLPALDMAQMSNYLGELGCREFAYAHRLTGTSLRLGTLVREEETQGLPLDYSWVDLRDAAQAFECALRLDSCEEVVAARRWRVYHICAAHVRPRFLIAAARNMGYEPIHHFARGQRAAG